MRYQEKNWITIRFERATRFYCLRLHQDLFGSWKITKINGQRGSALGRLRDELYETYEEAFQQFIKLVHYRVKQRHYQLIECHPALAHRLIS